MSKSLITPLAILSYPYLFKPQKAQNEGDKDKFSAALIFTKENQGPLFTALKQAVIATAMEKWGDKAAGMITRGSLRTPFRTDVEEKGYPEGSVFINPRSDRAPGVVTAYLDPATNKARVITDPDEAYAGSIVRASVVPFAYDVSGNKGVSFALNNVQVVVNDTEEAPRLDGRRAAEDEFGAEPLPEADLAALEAGEETASNDETEPDENPSDESGMADLLAAL